MPAVGEVAPEVVDEEEGEGEALGPSETDGDDEVLDPAFGEDLLPHEVALSAMPEPGESPAEDSAPEETAPEADGGHAGPSGEARPDSDEAGGGMALDEDAPHEEPRRSHG